MEVIQADLCYMPHDRVGNKIYKYALNCVDIASRTKWTYPLTDRDSASVAKGFLKLYKFHNFPLTQLKILQTDYGSEFYGKCEKLMIKYNIEISRSKSKKRQGIVERYNRTLQEWSFYIQDGVELLLPPMERCRAWVNDLPIFLEKIDNTKTRLIGMSPAEARKLKHDNPELQFEWLETIQKTKSDASRGYFVNIKAHFPIGTHDKLKDLPPAVENIAVKHDWLSYHNKEQIKKLDNNRFSSTKKLVTHLGPRDNYVIHYLELQYYVKLGLVIDELGPTLKRRTVAVHNVNVSRYHSDNGSDIRKMLESQRKPFRDLLEKEFDKRGQRQK
ncbi:19681_t:CDS:2 [Entrophospora sp. SA101]|nr:19681_t:CDS:2 [Entrophospora sp. SA101]